MDEELAPYSALCYDCVNWGGEDFWGDGGRCCLAPEGCSLPAKEDCRYEEAEDAD